MQRVERTATIPAPVEEVFAYISDLAHLSDWQAGVVSAERTTDGEMRVGATARVVRQLMGQRIEAPLTVTAYEPPHRMVFASEVSGVKASGELSLAPSGDGTELRFAMEIRGSMLTAFMEPMIAGAAGGDIEASLQRVRARFEERSAS